MIVVLGALSAFGPMSIDMYLPAFPALARPAPVRAAERRPGTAPAAVRRAGRLRRRVGAVRGRAVGGGTDRAAVRAGAGRRGRDRHRPGGGAGPVLRGRRGPVLLAADARQRPGADARPAGRRAGAPVRHLAVGVRGARRARAAAGRWGGARAP